MAVRMVLYGLAVTMLIGSQALPSAAAAPMSGAQELPASPIINGILEAYGGPERIRAVEAYRLEATLQAHSRGQEARAVRISAGRERLQIMITYPDGAEVRMIDGQSGYSGSSLDSLTPAEGPALAAMTLQAARANVPWVLDSMRSQVTLVRTEGPYEDLQLLLSETEELRLLVDTRTHLIMTTESMVRAGPMDFHFRTEYSDFRDVDGIIFAFHEENFATGTHTFTTAC